jgi:hypothetical protein
MDWYLNDYLAGRYMRTLAIMDPVIALQSS